MSTNLGRVVYSKAGRDKGKVFVITGFKDQEFVLISDGDIRPVSRPKKKRKKHVAYTECVLDEIRERLIKGRKILDADIRKALRAFEN